MEDVNQMGAKLVKFFELIKAEGGMMAQMRLAMKTQVSSETASSTPDSPDKIAVFKAAFKDITGKDAPIN